MRWRTRDLPFQKSLRTRPATAGREASRVVAESFGLNFKKHVIPLLFASLQGKRHGLPLFDSVDLLGKDRTRVRLMQAIDFLGGVSQKKQDALKKAIDAKKGGFFILCSKLSWLVTYKSNHQKAVTYNVEACL